MSQCVNFYQIHRKVYSCGLSDENNSTHNYNMDDIHHVIGILGTKHYIISFQAGNYYISRYTICNNRIKIDRYHCNCDDSNSNSEQDICYNHYQIVNGKHVVKCNEFVTNEVMVDTTNLELCYSVTIDIEPHVDDNDKSNCSPIGKTVHGKYTIKYQEDEYVLNFHNDQLHGYQLCFMHNFVVFDLHTDSMFEAYYHQGAPNGTFKWTTWFNTSLSMDNDGNEGHIVIDEFVFSHGILISGQLTMCTDGYTNVPWPGTSLYLSDENIN